MKKIILGFMLIITVSNLINAQNVINLHSISTFRQPQGDGGYTLNGSQMTNARQKLLNPNNFGVSGTYPKSISITDGYATAGSLTTITSNSAIDMFYFGLFDVSNFSLVQFTNSELDSLYAWSVRGGKLIIGSGAPNPSVSFNPIVLNSRWGFGLTLLFPTPIVATSAGLNSSVFTGPFGNVSIANQGGSSQGYFNNYPVDIVVLGDDGAGNPTMYLDCATLDLVVADGDAYTGLGGISVGNTIVNSNDRLWANTIAYMDALEGPPVIIQNGSQLTTAGTYNSYQWFLNGSQIPGATSGSYTMTQPGTYSVNVELACGCNSMAVQSVVYTGIGEIANYSGIYASPNPVGNQGLSFNGFVNQLTVELFTIDGKLVDRFTVNDSQSSYDTAQLINGLYFIKMYDMNGNFISVQRIVKN